MLLLYLVRVRYRFFKRVAFHYKNLSVYFLTIRYRFLRRIRFRVLRLFIFFIWRLWVGKIYGFERIPLNEPVIIVSNHLSYFDFWILSAMLRRNTVFVAVRGLDKRSFVGWTMKLNTIIYIDRDKPGCAFFKNLMWQLQEQRRSVVIYPEGTRSRSGKMLTPKPGFVKFAIKVGIPVLPIAMRGTYEIMPPHKRTPRLKKCDVYVLDKTYISPTNPEFYDIFFRKMGTERRYEDLDEEELQEIAFRIMDKVRIAAWQEWDETVHRKPLLAPTMVMKRQRSLLSERSNA